MRARTGRPGMAGGCATGALVARAGEDCMACGGDISQRQQCRRTAISTICLALIRPPANALADWYSESVFQSVGLRRHRSGQTRAGARNLRACGDGGIDQLACREGCVD